MEITLKIDPATKKLTGIECKEQMAVEEILLVLGQANMVLLKQMMQQKAQQQSPIIPVKAMPTIPRFNGFHKK